MEPLPPVDPTLLTRLHDFVGPVLVHLEGQGQRPLARAYLEGLLGPADRKTVEPIARAARGVAAAPAYERRLRAMLSADDWNHGAVMDAGWHRLLAQTDGWQAYTLDDTALLKQGTHSVGVANQYAGCVGGLANSQVLVTLGVAQEHVSAPWRARLFLPEAWCKDAARRAACHVPTTVTYQPKWRLALDLIRRVRSESVPQLPLLADSLYGGVTEFRVQLQAWAYPYVVGVPLEAKVWAPGTTFAIPPRPANGRPTTRLRPRHGRRPKDLTAFAKTLPPDAWHRVCWRDGSRGPQWGRFAAVRVRPSHGWNGTSVHPDDLLAEEGLLLHWPDDEPAPTKAWLSNLPPDTPLGALIELARLRWRVERDYEEGKGLVGLDHYEGRTWHGLHHHAALVVLAQQFLATARYEALHGTAPPAPPAPPVVEPAAFSP